MNLIHKMCVGGVKMLNIRKYRKIKNMSQQELAKLAGIDQTYISKLENGTSNNPTFGTIEKIAKALDIAVNDLLNVS